MGRFVTSQTPESNAVVKRAVHCSSWKELRVDFALQSPLDFEMFNFVDLFIPKHKF